MTCDLNYSEDQRQILDAAAALLATSFPVARNEADDPARMSEIADFGGFALGLDEALGGTGFSLVEEALMHVLLGRHNVSTRALASPIAARIAGEIGRADLAQEIATGMKTVCAAIPAGERLRLLDGNEALLAVVFAGRHFDLVDISAAPAASVDGLGHDVAVSDVAQDGVHMIGASNSSTILNVADVLIAAQLLGNAEATRDLAVDYAGTRRQFGKPIGAFQAIKHHCANMAISAETLSALLDMAAISVRDGRQDADFQTAALRLIAPRTALANVRLCIQIHGGIGFSAEANPHRFLKRAHVLKALGGTSDMLAIASPMEPLRA